MCSPDCLLVILAIIFPPLPVWVKRGLCSADSVINIALCVLGFVPGLIHSWYIIATTPEDMATADGVYYQRVADEESGAAGGPHNAGRQQRVVNHYYYVQTGQPGPRQPGGGQQSYGTVRSEAAAGGEAGRSSGPPPSYSEVVPGDNKIQKT